jgi:malonyl-CoA/methylmalonyl-CoA synthetase
MAQAKSLCEAWHYSPTDHFLHVLPLHHIHGTVNALLTPLLAGSTIEFLFPFTVDSVWSRLAAPFLATPSEQTKKPITFFTVVPTIYNRLLQSHNTLSPDMQNATKEALHPNNMRLNISGSAALPTPTKQAWTNLSNGNVLLERYGMTEVGMALSCGLANEDRVDGSVGWPLPSVEARLVDLDTKTIIEPGEELDANGKERSGEIQLRGPTIFKEYWNNPTATAKEFTEDGYFKTGDVAVRRNVPSAGKGASGDWAQGPMYFILGRLSADIIKVGGEKVSALEVEREMLSIPAITECAVVGLPSETWGQKVAAVVVLSEQGKTAGKGEKPFGAMDLRRSLRDKMAAIKIPQDLKVVDSIPRNAMGKSKLLVLQTVKCFANFFSRAVNKKQLVIQVFGPQA